MTLFVNTTTIHSIPVLTLAPDSAERCPAIAMTHCANKPPCQNTAESIRLTAESICSCCFIMSSINAGSMYRH
jgi:hypothetical protein